MNAVARKALKASIAHWQRMALGKRNEDEAPSSEQCALCLTFQITTEDGPDCPGCPILQHTGLPLCHNTPYQQANNAWHDCGPDSAQFKAAAAVELDFLRSLLPKRK
jgi:hypothetical protein